MMITRKTIGFAGAVVGVLTLVFAAFGSLAKLNAPSFSFGAGLALALVGAALYHSDEPSPASEPSP
ncbi:MAG: hypothetical protein V1881_02700 [Candidatus Micrarchaeota archaeon]